MEPGWRERSLSSLRCGFKHALETLHFPFLHWMGEDNNVDVGAQEFLGDDTETKKTKPMKCWEKGLPHGNPSSNVDNGMTPKWLLIEWQALCQEIHVCSRVHS